MADGGGAMGWVKEQRFEVQERNLRKKVRDERQTINLGRILEVEMEKHVIWNCREGNHSEQQYRPANMCVRTEESF